MGRQALRSLTPGPSPGGRGGTQVSGIAVGCAVRTVTDVEGAHSAPYKLHPFSQVPPLPPGEGPGVRLRRAHRQRNRESHGALFSKALARAGRRVAASWVRPARVVARGSSGGVL